MREITRLLHVEPPNYAVQILGGVVSVLSLAMIALCAYCWEHEFAKAGKGLRTFVVSSGNRNNLLWSAGAVVLAVGGQGATRLGRTSRFMRHEQRLFLVARHAPKHPTVLELYRSVPRPLGVSPWVCAEFSGASSARLKAASGRQLSTMPFSSRLVTAERCLCLYHATEQTKHTVNGRCALISALFSFGGSIRDDRAFRFGVVESQSNGDIV